MAKQLMAALILISCSTVFAQSEEWDPQAGGNDTADVEQVASNCPTANSDRVARNTIHAGENNAALGREDDGHRDDCASYICGDHSKMISQHCQDAISNAKKKKSGSI